MDDYYNKIAGSYDELYLEEQLEKLNILARYFKPKGLVLDIGAGTGVVARYFKDVSVISLDPAEELLKQCPGRTVVGKAESLPFKDNMFDTIISLTALHHTDIEQAISEIKRVAKDDAIFAFSILKKAKEFERIVELLNQNFRLKHIETKKDEIFFSF